MNESFYGFTEKPFGLAPDPRFLYPSASHADGLAHLRYAIDRREGFVVVTGDVGTGKTTLCRALLERAPRDTLAALLLDPFRSEEDLLTATLRDLGVVSRAVRTGGGRRPSRQELVATLHDFLLSLVPLGARAVLVVDEAQDLPLPLLEQVRILANMETDRGKLLQIVLVGQLELTSVLRSPELRQLDQRVSVRYELRPLTGDEVGGYVAHRLAVADPAREVAFTPAALHEVHRVSGGVPRVVNLLCDRALLAGATARTHRIDEAQVRDAARDLALVPPAPPRRSWIGRMLGRRAP